MGSSTGAILFYCVALSVVAAAVVVSPAAAAETSSRKLIGAATAGAGACPVRFDRMKGYEALGAKCKKPSPVRECCAAFKALACPYNKLINDVNNGCADDMFYFIQTKGKLRPGTIFENCLEGPQGLKC
ncbi:hypothetical protein E2562_011011 [Oryza meyeriana var. granulata]|uniref:GPI-anchored protein LLG1-like domain-containing protein n=1 Tax=Oryza meyeriana var. granulata TaxID=110450 RepID=A0A6G1BVF2_9ORYZ|nr:hypothetical protein E2562_011011 [Oryza meyeriana var. granulata]